MGVYINGMGMPDNCEKCELSKAVITGLSTYRLCPILRRAWRRGKPGPTCPIIEVPQHGRLIDADECHKYFYDHLDDLHMEIAEIAIEEMPTIIEADGKDINGYK